MRLLVAALTALVLAVPALADNLHPSQRQMEAELVCPTCHEPLDESSSPIAQRIKDYIRKRIAEGATENQIKDELVAQLGPRVLGVPSTHGFDLLAWVIPLGGMGLGFLAVGAGAWAWSRNRSTDEAVLDPGASSLGTHVEKRLDDELARFDG
ncbi:MAG: cytochrome c-type biogenesis protein CcmH [Actinomycetes bacterium]